MTALFLKLGSDLGRCCLMLLVGQRDERGWHSWDKWLVAPQSIT